MTDASHDHGAAPAAARRPIRILTVCWANSARSIMCEVLLRHLGGGQVDAYSAGIRPAGVNPVALRVIEDAGLPVDGLRSKSVE